MSGGAERFGSCCATLAEVLAGEEYDPLVAVDDDGVLRMTVGTTGEEGDDDTEVVLAVVFCPFCGTKLQ